MKGEKSADNRTFDVVYSIGQACPCARDLGRMGLRTQSGPFDWNWQVGFYERFDMMVSRFDSFIEKEDLYLVEDRNTESGALCDAYKNRRTGFRHSHDFPAGVPLDESYPKVREKYRRRIERMLSFLDDPNQRVLLVWVGSDPVDENNDMARVVAFCQRVIDCYGEHVHFLLIEGNPQALPGKPEYKKLNDNVELYTYHSAPPYFSKKHRKDICRIMLNYYVPGMTERRRKNYWGQILVNVLTAPIPVKKWRVAVRDGLMSRLNIKKF